LSSLDSRWIFENKNLWNTAFRHDTSAPFAYVLDDQFTETLANDVQELEQIAEENWPGKGRTIIQSDHLQPRTVLQKIYEHIPAVMKDAFGHFSSACCAIGIGTAETNSSLRRHMFPYKIEEAENHPFRRWHVLRKLDSKTAGVMQKHHANTECLFCRSASEPARTIPIDVGNNQECGKANGSSNLR
jgi:hypothetical protein